MGFRVFLLSMKQRHVSENGNDYKDHSAQLISYDLESRACP